MDAMAKVTGVDFQPEIHPRRPGDPARIVASGRLAERDLEWRMRHTVEEMVASAWEARQAAGPAGQESR
jgi:UDP-glucose 4-epimerase